MTGANSNQHANDGHAKKLEKHVIKEVTSQDKSAPSAGKTATVVETSPASKNTAMAIAQEQADILKQKMGGNLIDKKPVVDDMAKVEAKPPEPVREREQPEQNNKKQPAEKTVEMESAALASLTLTEKIAVMAKAAKETPEGLSNPQDRKEAITRKMEDIAQNPHEVKAAVKEMDSNTQNKDKAANPVALNTPVNAQRGNSQALGA